MKETVQYSIGGYAFTLEKDASAALQEYIAALEKHYLSQDGGKEIMEGIEERVAELLLEKCGHGGVVSLEHVQAVIRVIGRPERIEADDPGPVRAGVSTATLTTSAWAVSAQALPPTCRWM